MLFHVAESVLISIDNSEIEFVDGNIGTNKEILSTEVLGHFTLQQRLIGLLDTATLQKFATNNTLKEIIQLQAFQYRTFPAVLSCLLYANCMDDTV